LTATKAEKVQKEKGGGAPLKKVRLMETIKAIIQ